jgi:DNA polymerase
MNKEEKLKLIDGKISQCTKCEGLVANRTKAVPGVGVPSQIVFLGEAPGKDEDRIGEPFVGRAGKLLDEVLEKCGLSREKNIYITNTCKCRPPKNRNPEPEEATNCRPFLDLQRKVINPTFIVCLGAVAAQNLLGVDTPIGYLRGEWHNYGKFKVLCTWHPAYALRNRDAKEGIFNDLQLLLELNSIKV